MPKHIHNLFKVSLFCVGIAVTLFIGYLSLKRVDHIATIRFPHLDKIYHAVAYFSLSTIWLICFYKSYHEQKLKYRVVAACILYGMVIELLQGTLTTYRTASVLDVCANTVGVLLAMMLFKPLYKIIEAI